MMRLYGVVAAAVAAASVVAACTAFDRDDADARHDDAAAPPPDAHEASTSSDASDAGVDSADARPPGAIVFDDFDVSCGGGDVTRVTVEHVTDAGAVSGAGACRVCLTALNDGFWHKAVPSVGAGAYRFEAHVKKLQATQWSLRVNVVDPDGGVAQKYNNGDLGEGWSLAQVFASAAAPARLEFDVIVAGTPGDCYLLDDVAVIAE